MAYEARHVRFEVERTEIAPTGISIAELAKLVQSDGQHESGRLERQARALE